MERDIRNAGGAHDFTMTIYYPDATTLTPSGYEVTYTLNGDTRPTVLSYGNNKEGGPDFNKDHNPNSGDPDDHNSSDDQFLDENDAPFLIIGLVVFLLIAELVRRKTK